jgi:tRNA C32,U32 (ribose-2'-O)-methylase TrmJ
MRLVRRLFGRAQPTGRELRTLRGVFRRASQRLNGDSTATPEDEE